MVAAASSPLPVLRHARTTWAPTRASSRAVTRPNPLLAPVTMTVRPANDGKSAAVQLMPTTLGGQGQRRAAYFSLTLKPLMIASTSSDAAAAWSASVVTVNCTR